jgi:hypothetical protein
VRKQATAQGGLPVLIALESAQNQKQRKPLAATFQPCHSAMRASCASGPPAGVVTAHGYVSRAFEDFADRA